MYHVVRPQRFARVGAFGQLTGDRIQCEAAGRKWEVEMKPIEIDVRASSKASPTTVYEVAKDSSRYPAWSQIGSFEHVRAGDQEPYGVGSQRIFRTGPLKLFEEVVQLEPGRRVAYVVHRGLPFREYRADIELSPLPAGGTAIRWRNCFWPKYPSTGSLCRLFMQYVLGSMTPALAREADRIERGRSVRAVVSSEEFAPQLPYSSR
jgi:hypothetical protein